MTYVQTAQLIDTIASKFFIPRGAFLECRVAVQVMMLPDPLFQQLFVQLALDLNVSPADLIKTFFDHVVMTHFVVRPCFNRISLKLEVKEPKFKQTTSRTQSATSLDFQNNFSTALVDALTSSSRENLDFADNAQLCKAVNQHFLKHGQVEIWRKVGEKFPEKNPQQLRDYYQKSFQRCMFQECISSQDKQLLCRLIDEMTGQKPSLIAERFFETVGTEKYFKRNIIMYVVNRRQM
ncbi:SANT/Myb_domain [Hexamita inflata]|uniref:SANT/Myb domain n=1 Tax=Hexamita inflata TaxID=28002 RepID=A0AA86U7M0_9EUKA|nr:SANT/Myb domain [Hexamita inflata]